VVVPTSKKQFWRPEALRLRKVHGWMIFVHLAFLLFIDNYFYGFELMTYIWDFILVWFNFYNYMTLNKLIVGAQVVVQIMGTFIALTHFQRVFL